MSGGRKKNASARKVPEAEKQQVRARRELGHAFALTKDERGRDRLRTGTAEAQRHYDISNGGIVRVRNIDPLVGISSLSDQQRAAGIRYRTDYETASSEGMRTGTMMEHVDGGKHGAGGLSVKVMNALASLRSAQKCAGHPKLVRVLDQVCGEQRSLRDLEKLSGVSREVLVDRLRIGLDNLVDVYSSRR
jgi:hypothetical protein